MYTTQTNTQDKGIIKDVFLQTRKLKFLFFLSPLVPQVLDLLHSLANINNSFRPTSWGVCMCICTCIHMYIGMHTPIGWRYINYTTKTNRTLASIFPFPSFRSQTDRRFALLKLEDSPPQSNKIASMYGCYSHHYHYHYYHSLTTLHYTTIKSNQIRSNQIRSKTSYIYSPTHTYL